MKIFTCVARCLIVFCLLLLTIPDADAQRIYATTQTNGASGLLCINCIVTNPANAIDGNLQTASTLTVAVGVAAQTYQTLIFPGTTKISAGTPVTVKLGTGNSLVTLTALGGITLQAYNGSTAVDIPVAASTLLSALSNNNQLELSITPSKVYDRVRVTLNGGLVGALSNLFLYGGFYNGPAAGACNSSIDELHGISAGLLNLGLNVGGVVNPQNAIDGNLNTASTLNAGVGLVGAYAQQTIIYEAASNKGDSIRLTLSIPDALIQAGILSNISVSTYNGTNSSTETYTLTASLLKVQLLGLLANNNRKVTVTYAPVNIFDRVQVTLGGIVGNVLSSLNLYEAQKLIPKPVVRFNNVVTSNASICAGSTALLTATASPNTTFLWYTSATATTTLFTGSSFTTPVLTATTTYYVAAMRTGCTDQSKRTAVTVTVNNIPANAVVTNNTITVCPGQQASFTAQSVTGVTINWYTAATGGTLAGTGNTFTTGALTQTSNFYAEAVAGGTCVSLARTKVTANVSALPAAPVLTAPAVNVCDGNVAVFSVAAPITGVTYNWYSTLTSGTSLYTGITFTSPALHTTTIYYAEAINTTGCAGSSRTTATATVTPKPANPILAANSMAINAGQKTTITVSNAQTGITYNWYTSATAGASIFTGSSFTTPALYTNTTYYVSALNAAGCESAARTAVTIKVNIDTNTPCAFANTQTSTINGLCLLCSITNNALSVDADTTTASTIAVPVGLTGAYAEQNLTFSQPGLKGDTVKIVLQTPVNLADVSVAAGIEIALYNGTTQVQRYALNNSLIKLSLLGGGSNRYAVYVPANANYTLAQVRLNSGVATLLTGLQVYYAVQQYPKTLFTPASPEVCKGSTALVNISSPATGTYQWFTTPTGGTAVFTGTTFTTPALNANTTYYIAYSRGTCAGTVRYPVTVLVDSPPAAPIVTPSTTTVFSGKTATFTASVGSNVTVKWYTAATGGTPIFTGLTFTSPALTTPVTYYAESSLGDCISPTRTPAKVTITANVVPNVTVNPATQKVNPGTTASLTASSTTAGTIFNWYTSPTGGTSIYTGATFTTPPVFTPTTYYAEAVVTASGTVSATRASGAVTVAASTVNPTACDAAIAQTSDINGLICLLCSVNNAAGAVDNDQNSFSQLDVPVGLLNAYAAQTLRFANTGRAGDTVVVELGTPASLASAGVLSGISLATYNGTVYNGDRFSLNTSLINITLLNGTSRFRYTFIATKDFDRVEIRLNSALAGVLNALNIYDASQEVAAPVIAANNITACQGTQATITATVPSYVTVRWYTTATGGTPVFTGSTFNTPVLTATTRYYAEASRTADGCTQAVRTPVTITVTPTPVAPVVTVPAQTVCSGSPATFTAKAVNGVTFSWYTAATGGAPVFTGNPFVTPALSASVTYYAEANGIGTCGSTTRTPVTANVTATPGVPVLSQASVQTCSGSSAVLTATSAQTGVTFNWYTAATGGVPIFTGAQFTTPALTANTTYFVESENGSCSSAQRVRADVVVNPIPVQPVVTINPTGGQILSGKTATLSATSGTAGVTFNWYNTATGGSPVFTGATFVTPALSSNTTYYVDAVLASTDCISAARTPVNVTVNPIFSTSCDFASTQTNTINGLLCVACSVANPNNSVDTDTTNFTQLNLPLAALNSSVSQNLVFGDSGIIGDTVTVRLRIPGNLLSATVLGHVSIASYSHGTYNGDRLTLDNAAVKIQLLSGSQDVLVKFVPKAVYDAVQISLVNNGVSLLTALDIFYATKQVEQARLNATTVNICSGSSATFTVSNARSGVTYKWYNSVGALVHTGTNFTTADLAATTTFFVESSRTATGCANPNRVAATANVTASPVNPVLAQNNVSICADDNVTLSVTNAAGATVQWYNAATGGILLFTGANYQVSPVINADYYVEFTNGNCNSPARTHASVKVNPRPAQAGVAAANVTVCPGSPATLNILSPEAGVTYKWYTSSANDTLVFTGTSFTTSAITHAISYYIQASNTTTGCTNNGGDTKVSINVTDAVIAPVLSATQTTVCNGGTVTLSINNPVGGVTYRWYVAATGGTPVFTGTTFVINNLTASIKYFVEAANSAGCTGSSRTETDITVTPVPTPPSVQAAAGNLTVCSGSPATLSIVNPQADLVYLWYDAATNGTLLFTGTEFTTPVLTQATSYFIEAANAGDCTSSARTKATVIINALPAVPVLTSSNVAVCSGSSATFTINAPQTGVSYKWYDSAAETNLLFTGASFTTAPVTGSTDFYVSAVNAAGCTSSNSTLAQVTVTPPPVAPVIANGSTVQSCTGSQVTLTIANPAAGFTYSWYTTPTGGTAVFTGDSFTTAALTASTTYYAEAVNSTGCSSVDRTSVNVVINNLPDPPTITAQGGSATPTVCAGSPATLTASSNTANVIFNWYTAATGGTPVFTGATYITPALNITTSYYVEAVSNNGGCISATRGAVQVSITQPPATPTLVSATVSACTGSPVTLSVSAPQTGVTYNWYDSATKTNLLFTGPTYVTGPINANTTFYVDAEIGSCASPSLASAVVTIVPAPGAPLIANGNAVTSCNGTQVTLSINNPQSGFTYNWYSTATGGTSIFTGAGFTTPTLTATTTFYAGAVNANGCPSASRTAVTITITPSPDAPQISAAGLSICPGTTAALSATSTGGATIKWYVAATGGDALATGNNFITPALSSNTTYYAEAVNTATGCISATRNPVVVSITQPLDAPVVTVGTTTPTTVMFQWAAVSAATGYQVSIDGGKTFTAPNGSDGLSYAVDGLTAGESVTIAVKATGNSECQLSALSAAVTGFAQNPFGDGIFVPNAFTPNGDGKNDVEYVYSNNIKGLTFSVYDQWGIMLYRSNSQANGWDGTYKGTRQPVGVYVYYLEAVMNDGQHIKKKGTITLLR